MGKMLNKDKDKEFNCIARRNAEFVLIKTEKRCKLLKNPVPASSAVCLQSLKV